MDEFTVQIIIVKCVDWKKKKALKNIDMSLSTVVQCCFYYFKLHTRYQFYISKIDDVII